MLAILTFSKLVYGNNTLHVENESRLKISWTVNMVHFFFFIFVLSKHVRRFWTYRSNKFLFIFILMFDEVNDEKACDHNLKLRIRITYSQQHGTYHLVSEIWLRFGADFVPHARACSFLPDSLGKIEKRIETLPLCSPNSRHNYSMDLLLARCIQP